ncbi:MAG TPA: tRNA pseudouridine(55) synthase TruB [Ferruginibacter sp.]|nr:tRNA pseudouridine(55) synthase TruB [Ferruginibacter sp.]
MANKDSYWRKHKEKIAGDMPESVVRKTYNPISAEQKALYEAGKVLLIDKPIHWTSFDVVRKIRNSIGIKKVGHAGTLDPLATGLLIVCTGKFTKQINEYMAQEKEYTGSFTLGAVTPTYDLESTPEQQKDYSSITAEQVEMAANTFIGDIQQLPPIYSAIKKQGTPLYELARRGEEVELKPRAIHIGQFEIVRIEMPVVHFRIVCSTGTYIRSIAHDMGIALGCGAYLSALRRTRIGSFSTDGAMSMEAFMESLGSSTS